MMLASFLFKNENISSGHINKPTEWPTVWQCTYINQEERRHNKTPSHPINVRWLTASVGELLTSGWHYTSLIFIDREVKFSE